MRSILVPLVLVLCGGLLIGCDDAPTDAPADDAAPIGDKPVVVMKTTMGDVEIELWPKAAPETVKNFIGLAEGTKEWTHPVTKEPMLKTPFFDGLAFHRVIKDFMVQGGCPLGNGMGGPGYAFEDEINAKGLGLDKLKLFPNPNAPHPWIMPALGRNPQAGFHQFIVQPLIRDMGFDPANQAELKKNEPKILERLNGLTLKETYELMGYKYNDTLEAHHPKRGVIAMANSGPNTNGSQFFLNVVDTKHLTGKHTVFGKIVKGMDIVDKISVVPVGAGSKPVTPVKIVTVRLKK